MNNKRVLTFCDAIREAQIQEMESDPKVFVYGIDVDDHKGIYGTTTGLAERFGASRCFATPLAEDSLLGFGIGAAINGFRPINVHIRADFMLLAMNQLVNMASSFYYGSGGVLNVPLVVRVIIGRGWGQGFQHAKTMHSIFAHIPGLKVVMPTTSYDAKGLLISAIRDNNPVIFMEHRWLYYQEGEVPESSYVEPLGKAKILREGSDVTIVAVSWMNVEAREAARVLAKRNISVEIVDPRTIAPLDIDTIAASVSKTGHCIVADYDWMPYGFGAEVAALVSEKCFGQLKSPVERLGFAHTPCPTTRPLENVFYPTAIDIIRVIERKLGLAQSDLSQEQFYNYEHRFKGPF